MLVTAGDPDHRLFAKGALSRTNPEASSRLLVMKDGVCVLDRGVRDDKRQDTDTRPNVLEETGLVETAWIASDARGALVATLAYRDRVRLVEGGGSPADDGFLGTTTLQWIDPSFPEGRFRIALEPGRIVREAIALPLGFGAAVSTQAYDTPTSDFRLYDLEGRAVARVPEEEASTDDVVATTTGGFVAVDLALVARPGVPDRAVRVYDLLQGTSWSYTWSYGSPEEPSSWKLDETGVLEVTLPGATRRFDRNGRPIGGSGSVREPGRGSRLFNRLRG